MSAPPARRYRRLLRLAGWSVGWERLWRRLWPAAALIGGFLALALFDLLPRLPGWLHAAVLALVATALTVVVGRAFVSSVAVDRATARRRLEADSGLLHRPLQTIEDRLVAGAGDPAAQRLWQRHQARAAAAIDHLSLRRPEPGIAAREPWGIRAGIALLLVIAVAAAGRDAPKRLRDAMLPSIGTDPAATPESEVWVRPPAYTNIAPLFLRAGASVGENDLAAATTDSDPPVEIPAGSRAIARVAGVSWAPTLLAGKTATPLTAIGDAAGDGRSFGGEVSIESGDQLAITSARGRTLAAWPMIVRADRPPTATLHAAGDGADPVRLTLDYEAADDYGVTTLEAVINAPDALGPETPPLRIEVPLAVDSETALTGRESIDLTEHPWAGTTVAVHLEAIDAIGQRGLSAPLTVRLPERAFTHPMARALIAERKRLLADDADAERLSVAAALRAVAATPEHFGNDVTVSLALAVADARLRHDRGAQSIPQVADILWQTALRVERGDVAVAERELQDARQDLWSALRRGASTAEIDGLIDRLQHAVDRYLTAVIAELARRGQSLPTIDSGASVLNGDRVRDLLDMARQFAQAGDRQRARQLLADVQRMLDSIRAGLESGQGGEALARAHQAMQTLRALAQRQRALTDDTFGRRRDGETAPPAAVGDQQAVRDALGQLNLDIRDLLGAIPEPLTDADRAMTTAIEALAAGRLDDALANQGAAADALQQAIGAVGAAMAQQLSGGLGLFGDNPDEGSGDPFGRTDSDGRRGFGVGSVALPDAGAIKRAHEILDELRSRANQRQRPAPELDYIDRLLRQF